MCQCCTETEKDIYLPELASVIDRQMLTDNEVYVRVALDSGQALGHQPGQFVEVSVAGIGEAPISISSSPTQEGFEMVVRNAGSLTRAIGGLDVGDKLGIRGPFGSGYPVRDAVGKDLVFICGGIGLVPQRSFINYVLDNRTKFGDLTILLGNKSYKDRLFVDELGEWSDRNDIHFMETVDSADPGWDGNVGVVTTLMPKIPSRLTAAFTFICGPPIMYKFVLISLKEANVPHENIFVNLERRMKCGVGKCGHCQINEKYACQDGPVFRYSDLATVPEAI